MQVAIEGNIAGREDALKELEEKKKSLLHDTSDDFAEKRSNDLIVKLAFCKDKQGTPYYSEEEFTYLQREDIVELVVNYNEATTHLTTDSIKDIACQDFFTAYYSLAEDNPPAFFNKPIHELTFFQTNLLSYARLINSICKNFSPPDHIRNDAKALIAFANSESQKKKRSPSPQGGQKMSRGPARG